MKYIYSVRLSGYWTSSVIYHLWWRELGRAADWTNECKCSARLAWVSSHISLSLYLFSPLSVQSKPINKCGISFTAVTRRLIFIKKRRNGHLLAPTDTWLCVDSDNKHTWQLNYTPRARFLFYLGEGNPCCVTDPCALKHGRRHSWSLLWVYTDARKHTTNSKLSVYPINIQKRCLFLLIYRTL